MILLDNILDLMPLFVVVPVASAFVIPVVSQKIKWLPDLLATLSMAFLLSLALLTVGNTGSYLVGGWQLPLGIELRVDGLTALMLVIVNIVGFAVSIYSAQYMTKYTSKLRFDSLYMFLIAGVNGVVLTNDFFNLFIFMEVAALASYALVAFGCEHEELEASFKYAVLGTLASSFILIAIAIVYGITGTLNMSLVANKIQIIGLTTPMIMALGFFICGFALKAALVPFHAWLPDAHPSAPAPVSATLSGVVIKATGIYVLARVVFNVFGVHISPDLLNIVTWLGVLSMIIGVVLCVGQTDMKRLMAYSTVSQIGYVALGLGLGTYLGVVGALLHMLSHSIVKSLLFLTAGSVEYATGTRDMRELGGLRSRMPSTATASMIASLSIAGVPPFSGFWSKLIIVIACVLSGHYWLALAAVLVSILTLSAFLKVQKMVFFEALKPATQNAVEVPFMMRTAMLFLMVVSLLVPLVLMLGWRTPFLVGPAMESLLRGITGF